MLDFGNINGYSTSMGQCVVGDTLELLNKIPDKSVNLVLTSPPYALQRSKEYGNEEQSKYIDWLCQFGEKVYNKLKDDGSFVLDIGGAYCKGLPAYHLYQFKVLIKLCDEIGFQLAQPFYWYNPSALPAPIEWVNKRKLRAKTSVETIWWLCKNPYCKADVRNVLMPYSDRMKRMIQCPEEFVREGAHRPSGHVMSQKSWAHDNGGSIPSNLLQISNSESNSQYLRICKEFNIKGHPARFPSALPEFFIKFLTDENDLVLDIFSGSNTTGYVAERLGRQWLSFELSKEYVASSTFRFISSLELSRDYYNKILDGEYIEIKSNSEMNLFSMTG